MYERFLYSFACMCDQRRNSDTIFGMYAVAFMFFFVFLIYHWRRVLYEHVSNESLIGDTFSLSTPQIIVIGDTFAQNASLIRYHRRRGYTSRVSNWVSLETRIA